VKKNLKNQETDGYGRDKRPEIEKLTKKEITITETKEIASAVAWMWPFEIFFQDARSVVPKYLLS